MSDEDKPEIKLFEQEPILSRSDLKTELVNIQVMGQYSDDNSPFDIFDSECHNLKGGISQNGERLEDEDDIVFMVNLSEHVQRPQDMLMFLGEYFKENIFHTERVSTNIKENKSGIKEQNKFYFSPDILNSLGSACKMYIENPRQQLRISIALSRSPSFMKEVSEYHHEETEQLHGLKENIEKMQLTIITRCIQIYKFLDYIHDRRQIVKLKHMSMQPPKCIINAILFKMKADYMRYIHECLTGESGILGSNFKKEDFSSFVKQRESAEISTEDEVIDCEKCNPEYHNPKKNWTHSDFMAFYDQEMTLLEFFEHEVCHEYEKAKRQIYTKARDAVPQEVIEGINEITASPFHPVFLSSLLNQQVFMRECYIQRVA